MREDMKDVFHDRPKRGSRWDNRGKGKKRAQQRIDVEDLPTREGVDRGYKSKNYHDGPLRRWLRSRVGELWDDIFKEVASVCDKRSYPQKELLDRLGPHGWLVYHDVQMIDGVPHDSRGCAIPTWGTRDQYYVHPETRRLEIAHPPDKRDKWKRPKADPYVRIDDLHQYHNFGGIWYLIEFKPYVGGTVVDFLAADFEKSRKNGGVLPYYWNYYNSSDRATEKVLRDRYGAAIVPVKKIQVGKKEIKRINAELAQRKRAEKKTQSGGK